MNFPILILLVWCAAMAAWFVVSKYFKKADIGRLKARLSGTGKSNKKVKAPPLAATTVIQSQETTKNRLAQMLVEKYQLGPKIEMLLEQAGIRWTAARFVHLTLVAFLVTLGVSWVILPIPKPLVLIPALAASGGPFGYVWFKRKTRLKRFEELFPETLEFISRSMRAGHAFSVSLEMIHREFQEPISGEFRRAFEEHNLGLPIEVALQKLAKRVPSLDVHFFVSAVLLQKRTGGNLAEILDKLAYVIRERFKLRGRIRAISAHGRMTGAALTCIPIAVAVIMFYVNPEYVRFFFTDDVGNIMMGSAIALQLIGYAVMKKIVNIEV